MHAQRRVAVPSRCLAFAAQGLHSAEGKAVAAKAGQLGTAGAGFYVYVLSPCSPRLSSVPPLQLDPAMLVVIAEPLAARMAS